MSSFSSLSLENDFIKSLIPIKKNVIEAVHSYGGILIGDGVSFAPHGFPDVKKLDVDFYSFSLFCENKI